jgi:hypothetical protein
MMRLFFSRHACFVVLVAFVLINMSGIRAEAKDKDKPKKTPGLALVVVTALSSAGYAGYQYLKNRGRK